MKIKIKNGKKYKSWRKWAIILGVFFLISIVSVIMTGKSILAPKINYSENLCSKIQYIPAWVKDGEIIDYGYKSWKILPEGYFFYYNSKCSACHRQINNFGEEYFTELKKNGYAIDCNK